MPNVSCDYMMCDEADPVIHVRTVPSEVIPAFPALQVGPLCIYPSRDQLHSIMCSIDDYLETVGYYEEAAFEDDDVIGIPAGISLDVEDTYLAVAAEAATG